MKLIVSFLILAASSQAIAALSWRQALEKGLDKSEPLQIQKSTFRAAEAEKSQSTLEFFPSLDFQVGQNNTGDPTIAQKSYLLVGQWNLFRSFADRAFVSEKSYKYDSTRNQLRSVYLSQETEILKAFLDLVKQTQKMNVNLELLEYKKKYYEVAQERYRRGQLSQQDVDKFLIDLVNTESGVSDQKNFLSTSQKEFERLIGPDKIEAEWPWMNDLSRLPLKYSFQVEENADWLAQKSLAESSSASRLRYERLQYPSVDLKGGFGQAQVSDNAWGNYWSFSLVLNINLFENGRNRRDYILAFENQTQQELTLERLRKQLLSEWQQSQAQLLESRTSANQRQQILTKAQKLLKDNLRRFQIGRASVNELLQDHERLFQAELLAIEGWDQVHKLWMNVCHLRGRNLVNCLRD